MTSSSAPPASAAKLLSEKEKGASIEELVECVKFHLQEMSAHNKQSYECPASIGLHLDSQYEGLRMRQVTQRVPLDNYLWAVPGEL